MLTTVAWTSANAQTPASKHEPVVAPPGHGVAPAARSARPPLGGALPAAAATIPTLTVPVLPGPANSGAAVSLDAAIAKALATNPQIQTAAHNVREAANQESLNKVQRGLTVGANVNGSITTYKTTGTPGSVTTTQFGLSGFDLPSVADTASADLFGGVTTGTSFSTTTTAASGSTTAVSTSTIISPVTTSPVTSPTPTTTSPSVSGAGAGNAGTASPDARTARVYSEPTTSVVHTPAVAALMSRLQNRTYTPDQSSPTTTEINNLLGSYGSYYNYGAGISATQPIDVFRLVDLAANVLHENTQFYALDLQRTANQLAETVKNAYYQALEYQSNIDTAQESVHNAETILHDALVEYKAGAAAQYDVDSGQSQLYSAQQSLIAARNNLTVELQTLNTLMGNTPDTNFSLVSPGLPSLPADFDMKVAVQRAFTDRPEMRQTVLNIDMAHKVTRLEAAGMLPTFGVGADLDYTGAYPGTDGKFYEGALLATIDIPLDDAGRTRANVRIARENETQQANLTTQLKQDIELEVRDDSINVINAQALVQSDQSSVAYNRELVRIAEIRYRAGAGTILELTTAQADLAIAETNLAAAEYQLQTSYAAYIAAIGQR